MVIFDKTGTLTKGEHGVVGIATVQPLGRGPKRWRWRRRSKAIPSISIARAMRGAAAERGLTLPAVSGL